MSYGPPGRPPKALEAARWLFETQKAQLAEDPNRPRSTISSTRHAADKFGVSKSSVARQLLALKNGKPDASSPARVGRPSRLTDVEEKMLGFHMFMLRRQMKPVSMKVVKDAADALLSRRDPPGDPVSGSWVRRWLRANRAQARAEAAKDGSLPGVDLGGADEDNEDEDTALGDDAPSDVEIAAPSDHGRPPTDQASNSAPSTANPVDKAADAITNIQSLVNTTTGRPSNG